MKEFINPNYKYITITSEDYERAEELKKRMEFNTKKKWIPYLKVAWNSDGKLYKHHDFNWTEDNNI